MSESLTLLKPNRYTDLALKQIHSDVDEIKKKMSSVKNDDTPNNKTPTVQKEGRNNSQVTIAIATVVLAVAAIGSVILLSVEINQFQKQTEESQKQTKYLSRTLLQTYRPLGVFGQYVDGIKSEEIKIHHPDTPRDLDDRFNLVYAVQLMNRGQGLLSYLGYITYSAVSG